MPIIQNMKTAPTILEIVNELSSCFNLCRYQEISNIENFKPDEKRLKIVRDFFLFQCYTGLSYIDVVSFDLKQILNYRNKKFIVVQRKKSGVESIIPLTEKAKQLLDLNSYKINYYSNQKTNKYLKEIAAECGIKKRLTTHVARKTFAQLNLENGMPIESVSRMLGHSSTVVTQRHYVITNITKVFNDVHHLATAA